MEPKYFSNQNDMKTPKENFDEEYSDEDLSNLSHKDCKIKGKNNQEYSLKIFQSEKNIIFIIKVIGDISGTSYKTQLNLKEFHKLNRIFKQYSDVEEVFTLFFQNFNDSKIVITKEDKSIKLSYMLEFLENINEISFKLKPQLIKIDNVVFNLCEKVTEIDIKLMEQNEENKKLRKECNELKNNEIVKINNTMINEINKIKIKYEKKIKELTDNLENLMKSFNFDSQEYARKKNIIDSNIIKYDELCVIEEGIKTRFNKKIKKFELLFRASRDGFGSNNFHDKCDGYSYTVTFVISSQGRRFGEFTDAAWDQSGNYKTGSNGFIFSLDNKEIYYCKANSNNIYCGKGCGPTFGGGHDLYLCNNCNTSNNSYDCPGNSYEVYGKKHPLAGSNNFYVKDYEVYKIEIE